MKKVLVLLLMFGCILFVNAQQDSTARRRNAPIDPTTLPANTLPVRTHDPVMIKQGDTYYLYATGMGIEIQSSKDLKNWTRVGRVFPEGQPGTRISSPTKMGICGLPTSISAMENTIYIIRFPLG